MSAIARRPWIATVPAVLLLGLLSGWLSGSGEGNAWFDALAKPAFMPPGWLFPVAWSLLYVSIGLALGLVLATPHPTRGPAVGAFAAQIGLNYAWSPVFFAMHLAISALLIIAAMILFTILAAMLFARIRRAAGLLMLPYLAWLCFAAALNAAIVALN